MHNHSLASIFACADDVGAALSGLKHLKTVYKLFTKYTKATGLTLKPKKCVMILTACALTPENVAIIRRWLKDNIPEWEDFQIAARGKYLGIHIGPELGDINWVAPREKFLKRVHDIYLMRPPLAMIPGIFSSKALSVMGYVAQMFAPPPRLKHLELRAAGKVLHVATNSFNTDALYHAGLFGAPQLPRPSAYLMACLIRSAWKTLKGFQLMHDELCNIYIHNANLNMVAPECTRPDGWGSDAICHTLTRAFKGDLPNSLFPGSKPKLDSLYRRYMRGEVKGSLQKKIYETLLSCTPLGFQSLIHDRFVTLGLQPEYASVFRDNDIADFAERIKHHSKLLPGHARFELLRSWTNGWFTSSRMKEANQLPCIFGCANERDSLAHYLQCDIFWTLVCSASHTQSEVLDAPPQIKCCVCGPSHQSITRWTIAFSVYHALRRDYSPLILQAIEGSHFVLVQDKAAELAAYFARDLNS